MRVDRIRRKYLRSIKVRQYEIDDLGENLDDGTIDYYLKSNVGHALLDDSDEVIAILGGVFEGVTCHSWMLASDLMYKYPVATLKLMVRTHKEAVEKGTKLFFTYNLPHSEKEIKCLESIGYVQHGRTDEFDDNRERILLIKKVD